jgi:hypothetical protein
VIGIFNKFLNDQSEYDFKINKQDLKRNLEYKVLTHVSKFTNDQVEKDFLIKNFTYTTVNSKNKKLPKLTSVLSPQFNKTQFGQFSGEKKMFETRGKKNLL